MFGGPLFLLYVPWGISPPQEFGGGSTRCGPSGVEVHSPCKIAMRVSGVYKSILPDNQIATVTWSDDQAVLQFQDGSGPGLCDTAICANSLTMADTEYVDWDLEGLSEADNDIGHGDTQDALGLTICNDRIYALFLKNKDNSTGDMVVGNAATYEWTDVIKTGTTLTLPPKSVFALVCETQAGIPVTEASSCNLRIAASGGTVNYGLSFNGSSS